MLQNLIAGQVAFFGIYSLMSGPNQMKLKRYLTVTPSSGFQSLATFHFCHTSVAPLALNVIALASLGVYTCQKSGLGTFIKIFGMGCAAASLAVAMDARSNPNQTQAGSLGASSAFLSYHAFKNPQYFGLVRYTPTTLVALALAYSLYYDDKAVTGGLAAGYAAFLMAL
jgi:membrane associated rhomboid family serine protease